MKKIHLAFLVLSYLIASTASAQSIPTTIALPELSDDQEMLILEVNLEPGQSSQPHRHNAHVFVYVLEGQVNMQVAGGELVTLSAGETFYENPENIHTVSENASDTEPARFLVHMLKVQGAAVTTPVSQ